MNPSESISTQTVRGDAVMIRQFEVAVSAGADLQARATSTREDLTIGTAPGNDLVLTDPSVSRHHCTLRITGRGLELRDLGSTNGTLIGENEIRHGYIQSGARIKLGNTIISVEILDNQIAHPLAALNRMGDLVGSSMAMRRIYPRIQQFAASDGTVLIDGETGTGKDLAAETIHALSTRRDGPFVVVDCGSLPRELIESELFGHVRGAFTGAERDRVGAFETASGGTLVLDELGELPLALQPVLLRALENRTIRRVGTTTARPIDVRLIATTNRDLRVEVNQRRFRSDLFYRIDVLRITMPPLRERPGDIAALATRFWRMLRPDGDPPTPELLADLALQAWPGNVRELRNVVERTVALGNPGLGEAPSYTQAKDQVMSAWEREWLGGLLAAHGGNISRAARAARMGRSHLRTLMARHGLQRYATSDSDSDDEIPADE